MPRPKCEHSFFAGHTYVTSMSQPNRRSQPPARLLAPLPPPNKCSELWPKKKSLPSQATKNIRQCRVFPGAAKGASFLLPPIYHLPLYSQHIDPPLGYSQHLSTNHHLPTHSFHSHSSCFASFCGLWIVACFHVISKLPTY